MILITNFITPLEKSKQICNNKYMDREHGVNEMKDLKDLIIFENPCATRDRTQWGGGALSSNSVSKLVRKKLCNFTLAPQNNHILSSPLEGEGKCARKSRKIAFTLAEVLITLGIIGVVAALTLPSVVAKFQQKSFSTAFKKEYSTLNNAINMVVYEQDTRDCYQTIKYVDGKVGYDEVITDCLPLKKGLISKLSLTPVKKDFVYPKSQDVRDNGGVSSNFGVPYDSWLAYMSAFMMKDGAIVLSYYSEKFPSGGGYANITFVVDVNGKKGPNRWGYDVFWLTLVKTSDNGLRLSDEYSSLSEKGGSLPRNILLNNWGNDYNKNVYWGLWN